MSKKATVLNVTIDTVTMSEAVAILEQYIREKTPHLVATANAEMVMLAQKDLELACILEQCDLVVPDGAGVVWAARYQGYTILERVAGYDLTQNILSEAASKGYRVFMFGSQPEIINKAKAAALERYPGLCICGTRHGFFSSEDESDIINTITAAKPDILLAALGVPKQEKWLARNLTKLNVPVCMGVGGTFDVMAGAVRRAPLWMQRTSLEWLFRLLCQPQRVIRMLVLPKFALKIIGKKKY
ncbi:WecB/TagA/CpsF family glycosyltransferase [Sporomusa acidovorans]|uniref:N-acetylglucosaminyldiphosphoundecaprenol N-acetyl-beta-D-mannosaminyltransferase n=1 Tax=Sporomusa acidovorans (strain ATCC 49682 / DSM 3132 / Mol) TaxID=1123286 RepID=A0ABZ3J2U5_SPOA4|nr:putative N-acetylmannosaminyltransferase [Sporomusa acidovorans DSM 3132]SDD42345.1 N-acetylglucosaminyldiphosphoundecaprenol N-acetyl-beta-D-mannosaminyltransferase [Sporomusa acidovorans]